MQRELAPSSRVGPVLLISLLYGGKTVLMSRANTLTAQGSPIRAPSLGRTHISGHRCGEPEPLAAEGDV
eukprot:1070695-Pyramimonas_sp.AAC.1